MNAFCKATVLATVLGYGVAQAADPVSLTVVSSFPTPATTGAQPGAAGLILGPQGVIYGATEAGGGLGDGAIFSITPTSAQSVVASFNPPVNGYGPSRDLVRDTAGNLYAALDGRGTTGSKGRVVKITPAGTITVLHDFLSQANDGALNTNSLAIGQDGLLYGVTTVGGTDSTQCGTFFHLKTDGTQFTAVNFGQGTNDTGACNPRDGVSQGPDGNFYGLSGYESSGVNAGSGSIFQVTPTGVVTTLYAFLDPSLQPPVGTPVVDQNTGALYFYGIARDSTRQGAVYRYDAGGLFVLHQFVGTDGAVSPYASRLLLNTDGRLYGTTSNGGLNGGNANPYYNDGVVFSLGLDGSFAVLHNFGAGASDGINTESPLTRARDGSLWGTTRLGGTSLNGTVFRLARPTAKFVARPSSILKGASAKLTWASTNTTDCQFVSGGVASAVGTAGSKVVTPAATTTYGLVCHGAGTVTKNVTVTVN